LVANLAVRIQSENLEKSSAPQKGKFRFGLATITDLRTSEFCFVAQFRMGKALVFWFIQFSNFDARCSENNIFKSKLLPELLILGTCEWQQKKTSESSGETTTVTSKKTSSIAYGGGQGVRNKPSSTTIVSSRTTTSQSGSGRSSNTATTSTTTTTNKRFNSSIAANRTIPIHTNAVKPSTQTNKVASEARVATTSTVGSKSTTMNKTIARPQHATQKLSSPLLSQPFSSGSVNSSLRTPTQHRNNKGDTIPSVQRIEVEFAVDDQEPVYSVEYQHDQDDYDFEEGKDSFFDGEHYEEGDGHPHSNDEDELDLLDRLEKLRGSFEMSDLESELLEPVIEPGSKGYLNFLKLKFDQKIGKRRLNSKDSLAVKITQQDLFDICKFLQVPLSYQDACKVGSNGFVSFQEYVYFIVQDESSPLLKVIKLTARPPMCVCVCVCAKYYFHPY
jgi:hypothetical protein